MDEIAGPALDARRQQLLEAKLGKLLHWEPPNIVDTVGPFEPSVFEEFEARRRDLVAQCLERLHGYTDAQIDVLVAGERKQPDAIHGDWRSFLEHRLSGRLLPWFAGGFGHPDHLADFDYWAKMPMFTVDEITCLTVGVEPEEFPKSALDNLGRSEPDKLWPAEQFLVRRRELLRRQFDSQASGWHVRPGDFLAWVEKVAFEAHPEFLRLLRQYHGPAETSAEPAAEPQRTHKREIDKIAQLFTAMAIEHLGYSPPQKRSPIPKEIAEIAASMGLNISADTILKYLRIGAAFLSKDWEPPKR